MSDKVQQDLLTKTINSSMQKLDLGNSPNDIKQQEALTNALIGAGLPENKLNGLISMAKDHLLCNKDCQKARESARLKKIWENSEHNLTTASVQVENAEKNYYTYDKGSWEYRNILFDRYSKTAEEMKQSSIVKHKTLLNELKILMTNYDAETIYSKRMYDLLRLRKKENKQLKEDIDTYIGTTQTSARKVDYENMETSWISTVRTVLTYIYYALFVLYILVSDYFSTKKYKDIMVWVMIVCYLIFPWLLNRIVVQFYHLKNYIHDLFTTRPYKNVYENL